MENQLCKPEFRPGYRLGGHCMLSLGWPGVVNHSLSLRGLFVHLQIGGLTEMFFVDILIFVCCL